VKKKRRYDERRKERRKEERRGGRKKESGRGRREGRKSIRYQKRGDSKATEKSRKQFASPTLAPWEGGEANET
jgi:hypothetical protein